MKQASLDESRYHTYAVYDNRVERFQREFPQLAQIIKEAPCERCNQIFERCDVEHCPKVTAWLIGSIEGAWKNGSEI